MKNTLEDLKQENMERAKCVTCDALEKAAIRALTEYPKLAGRLEVARLMRAQHEIARLEPLVEAARITREEATAEYIVHRKTHQEAESAGG